MGKEFKLKNGSILVATEAPGGLYNSAQLKKIAEICESDVAVAKATEDHRLALLVKSEEISSVAEEVKSVGLGIRHYQDGLHQPTSCIGALCSDHEQDALGAAIEMTEAFNEMTLDNPLKIGINGCYKCCACHTLDISIIGETGGYRSRSRTLASGSIGVRPRAHEKRG